MSAEAPRNSGTGEPVTPQKPKSGFSGLLSRLFAVPLVIMQPPLELSDFAVRLNKGVADGLGLARQDKLARIELERKSAEKTAREKEAEEQYRRQRIEERLRALEEIKQIAKDLGIQNRLAYINTTVWEGKGQVQDVSTSPSDAKALYHNWNPSAGFELTYSYQSTFKEEENYTDWCRWRYKPCVSTTFLRIVINSYERGGIMDMDIASPYFGKGTRWEGRKICAEDLRSVGDKLDQTLVDESTIRVRNGAVPSKLFLFGQEHLRQLKINPRLMQWESQHFSVS